MLANKQSIPVLIRDDRKLVFIVPAYKKDSIE